jgi:ATP-dependent helicase HrpB
VLPDVLGSLSGAPSLVLQADAGAGKTTIVPLALLLDEPSWLPFTGKILVRSAPGCLAVSALTKPASPQGLVAPC